MVYKFGLWMEIYSTLGYWRIAFPTNNKISVAFPECCTVHIQYEPLPHRFYIRRTDIDSEIDTKQTENVEI
jgi:hypothetical protein